MNETAVGAPLVDLAPAQCWPLGEFEGRLASLAAEAQGKFAAGRESLRGMFVNRGSDD